MELTVVVSVLGLDCAQHSSRIAPLNGDRDPLEEELEGMRLPCFFLEAMSQFILFIIYNNSCAQNQRAPE